MTDIIATLLIERAAGIDAALIGGAVAGEAGATLKLEPAAAGSGAILQGPGGPVTARLIDAPLPQAAAVAEGAWWWPGASQAVARHGAYLEVSCPWAGLSRLEGHIRHTVLTQSVLGHVPAVAVVWGRVVVAPGSYRAMFEEMVDARRLPVPLWVRIDLSRSATGGTAAATDGMGAFGLMEIEIAQSPLEPGELFEYTRRLSEYLIMSGPVVGDGDAVGNSDADRAIVRHAPSLLRPGSGTVYQLAFAAA